MSSGPLETATIDGRTFPVDGEVDAAKALDGYTNEVKPNGQVGSFRIVKSRKPGRMNSIPLVMDDARGDEEFIQERMDSNDFFACLFTQSDGTVFSGNMQIVEDPETSTKEGTKEVSFMGSLKKQ